MNMKLKFFIAGAAIVAGLASAVSCQDISKDLTALQDKVKSLESTVQNLQDKIDGGAVITSVTPTNSGIVITLSNGNKYEITNGVNGKDGTNGKDGKNGSVVTIGANGNWFIDGEDTGMAAAGQDGTPGEYYVPNPETGCFDKYVWVEENGVGAYVKEATTISYLAPGTITAVYDPETGVLTLFNVEGGEGELGIVTIGGTASEVASIQLVEFNASGTLQEYDPTNPEESLISVVEQKNEFHGLVFGDGTQVQRGIELIVKVNPTNYQLKAEDIKFVTSNGRELDLLKVTDVYEYPYEITKATTSAGLWVVEAELAGDYDKASFDAATKDAYGNPVAFAIKVGESITNFALSFDHVDYADATVGTRPNSIFAMVGTAFNNLSNIANYKNRYLAGKELVWKASSPKYPTPATSVLKDGSTLLNAQDPGVGSTEDRTGAAYKLYNVVPGQPFIIYANIDAKAIYVTFDEQRADSDELNTWKSYDITGLNEVSTQYAYGNPYQVVTINSSAANGDEIGLRIHAVNWDGTLTDPDGTAFYVLVGQSGDNWGQVATTMSTPDEIIETTSNVAKVTTTKLTGATQYTFQMLNTNNPSVYDFATSADVKAAFKLQFVDGDGKNVGGQVAVGDAAATQTTNLTAWKFGDNVSNQKVKGVKVIAVESLHLYKDDTPYYGVLSIQDNNNKVLAQLIVALTKSLPDGAPSGFTPKTAQIIDGVYNCYLEPNTWNAATGATQGTMNLDYVFNFPSSATLTNNYTTTFKACLWDTGDSKTKDNPVVGKGTLTVDKRYVDSKTEHPTTVAYNYGLISSEDKHYNSTTGVFDGYNPVKRTVYSFTTIFNNIYDHYSWSWKWDDKDGATARAAYKTFAATNGLVAPAVWTGKAEEDPFAKNATPVILYGATGAKVTSFVIDGTCTWSNTFNGTLAAPYAKPSASDFSLKPTPDATTSGIKEPVLVSGGVVNEYFKVEWKVGAGDIEFTPTSSTSEPAADVDAELQIFVTDMYGTNRTIKLPVTIKKP
jgi:hypothetical protein